MSKNSATDVAVKKEKPATPGIFSRFGGYLHDVKLELKRVVWPSKDEVTNSSLVVVVTLAFFIVFIYAVDTVVVPVLLAFSKLG